MFNLFIVEYSTTDEVTYTLYFNLCIQLNEHALTESEFLLPSKSITFKFYFSNQ